MNFSAIDKGLLRFCLEHSDGPRHEIPSNIPQRDPADYVWLREALNNLEDDVQKMKRLVEVLKKEDTKDTEKAYALEELQYLVEDIDNAQDLHKIEGYVPVLRLLSSPDTDVRRWATWVISTCAQNNPWAQQRALEKGTLPRILNLLKTEKDEGVVAKALAAVSALLRENSGAQDLFLKHADGLQLLASIICNRLAVPVSSFVLNTPSVPMTSSSKSIDSTVGSVSAETSQPSTTVTDTVSSTSHSASLTAPQEGENGITQYSLSTRMKAAFLLRTLLLARPDLKDELRKKGILADLIRVATGEGAEDANSDLREKVLLVLQEAVRENSTNLKEVKRLGLPRALERHIAELEGRGQTHSTELDICHELRAELASE
jgi:hsp70-interacting protein